MGILLYGLPIAFGAAFGYIFSLPVNIGLSVAAVAFAAWSLWATRDAEIGSIMGVIVAIEAVIFLAAMWVTIAIIGGFGVDISWMLRATP
jgi:hypothetical protein